MKTLLPTHILDLLQERRDKFICEMDKEGFKLTEIASVFNLTSSRIHQIILSNNSKQLNK